MSSSNNNPNPNNNNYHQGQPSDEVSESNKRTALAGQWRTPPVPTFPKASSSNASSAANPNQANTAAATTTKESAAVLPPLPGVEISKLPNSAEDYAKALQEAYLRGAEAAAAMAAGGLPTAVSCPDFSDSSRKAAQAATATESTMAPPPVAPQGHAHQAAALASSSSSPTFMHGPVTQPTMTQHTTAASAAPPSLVASMHHHGPPPPSQASVAPDAPTTTTSTAYTTQAPPVIPNPLPKAPPPAPPASSSTVAAGATYPPGQHAQSTPTTTAAAAGGSAAVAQPARAMSLPDMTTYAAQQEEEKRQKRLARNRASARLRRLRKKNLVDAYEQEVGILEKTLEQLKAHEWGKSDNAGALAEALSMDRGQQVLDLSERQKEAAALLEQQLGWVHMLEDIMMEDYVLHQLVANPTNPELQELASTLQLSPEQLRQVEESKTGWQEEWDALQTVKASLQAMQENEWLWNESVVAVAEQFMGILHKNQISKFLLWADHNAEAIDELDGVHASQGVPSGPVFSFGVESQPDGSNDDDK